MARYSLTGSSFIVCLYKGKENAWKRGESRVQKLTKQVMKVLERIVNCLIRQLVSIDDSQSGFVPGRGTTNAVIVVTQLRVYLATNKRFYMAFVDLEKAFDGVPLKVVRWALRKKTWFGLCDWCRGCMPVSRAMSVFVRGTVKSLRWRVGVYEDSILSLLLFIIVLEALPHKFRSGVPWEDLYTSNLVIIAESFEECVGRLLTWKEAMEEKGQSKCRKDKDHNLWYRSGPPAVFRRGSCAVCRTGVGRNRIFCNGCKHWVHKKCCGIKCLAKDPDYRCTQCQGTACPLDSRPHREVPSRTWQAGGGSFVLLPGKHALSSRWLWTLKHNTCENHLEEVQGVATGWLFPPALFQDIWVCVERNAPCL